MRGLVPRRQCSDGQGLRGRRELSRRTPATWSAPSADQTERVVDVAFVAYVTYNTISKHNIDIKLNKRFLHEICLKQKVGEDVTNVEYCDITSYNMTE